MIKAIETEYKGYKFRSRLEARWAVYFDAIKLKWEYEKEGFILEDGTRYLPDFYIEGFGFIEIKGKTPTENEIKKAKLLSKKYYVAIFEGIPGEKKEYPCFYLGNEICGIYFCSYTVKKWGQIPFWGEYPLGVDELFEINLAKSARFEFGENR